MTSTIKVNNIQNQCGANIINESSNTITLGASGDTIALASGASQTGFGREGSVNWDTTAKTAGFTGVSGNGYFVNTTSGAITVNLPASPSAGDIMAVKDYTGTFGTNACTVGRNSSNIRGAASDFSLEKDNAGAVFIYVDATEGWQVFVDGSDSDAQATFVEATGGSITTSGDFKIHTFTGPGTFCVSQLASSPANNVVDYLVVAGGGAGGGGGFGGGTSGFRGSGGGGAGGFRVFSNTTNNPAFSSSPANPLNAPVGITVTAQGFPITVGGGGSSTTPATPGGNGNNSVFSTITAAGGGGGGACYSSETPKFGQDGGSGGGSGADGSGVPACAPGSGNTPPVSPPQGNNGGAGVPSNPNGGGAGGGGGARAAGSNASPSNNGTNGGAGGVGGGVRGFGTSGVNCGSDYYFSGGGGGGNFADGGTGGGGKAGRGSPAGNPQCGTAATANTGGGGGGTGGFTSDCGHTGGAGGSGIVIIRYKFQ